MHRKVKKAKLKEDISPNVVPMIDIMFLLLLFFMLGADMSQREAIEISIPRAKHVPEPVDVEAKGKFTLTVVYDKQPVEFVVFSNKEATRYDLILEKKDGKPSLRRK